VSVFAPTALSLFIRVIKFKTWYSSLWTVVVTTHGTNKIGTTEFKLQPVSLFSYTVKTVWFFKLTKNIKNLF
jgi:hypothetical protein